MAGSFLTHGFSLTKTVPSLISSELRSYDESAIRTGKVFAVSKERATHTGKVFAVSKDRATHTGKVFAVYKGRASCSGKIFAVSKERASPWGCCVLPEEPEDR